MLIKRAMIRRVLNNLADDSSLKPRQRKAVNNLLARGPRALRMFGEALDDFAERKIGAPKAAALGDGTLLRLILDNLDEIVAAILAILEALK